VNGDDAAYALRVTSAPWQNLTSEELDDRRYYRDHYLRVDTGDQTEYGNHPAGLERFRREQAEYEAERAELGEPEPLPDDFPL
jgi:hypothetical protein